MAQHTHGHPIVVIASIAGTVAGVEGTLGAGVAGQAVYGGGGAG